VSAAEEDWKPELVHSTIRVFQDRTNEIISQLHNIRHSPQTSRDVASLLSRSVGGGFSSWASDLPLRLISESLIGNKNEDISSIARTLKSYVSHVLEGENKQAVNLLHSGGAPSDLVRIDPVEDVMNEYEKLLEQQVGEISDAILKNILRTTISCTVQQVMR